MNIVNLDNQVTAKNTRTISSAGGPNKQKLIFERRSGYALPTFKNGRIVYAYGHMKPLYRFRRSTNSLMC